MEKILSALLCICLSLSAGEVETFYGPLQVDEPILVELIESPAFLRLKEIHQYGVYYYTNYKEEYTRYSHSLGVFAILRMKNASLEEQIAGLLHDVSHTIFSHVGDWIFEKANQEKDYQNSIHQDFLEKYGLGAILAKYGYTTDQILPIEELFPMLEKPGPALCADRIEYNIQGAYYQGFITYEEAIELVEDLQYMEGKWVSTKPELMAKVVLFSLCMTEHCWGSPDNHLRSTWLAEAILRGVEIGLISSEEIHFGKDQEIWDVLMNSNDPIIEMYMKRVIHGEQFYQLVEPQEADFVVTSKFRGIDPWIVQDGTIAPLNEINPILHEEYLKVKATVGRGWGVKLTDSSICSEQRDRLPLQRATI